MDKKDKDAITDIAMTVAFVLLMLLVVKTAAGRRAAPETRGDYACEVAE